MTPNRPYLLRALFDWICDNNCTPYLLVDATLEGVEVPLEHVAGGRIVLNASGSAVVNFEITDEAVSFSTRFSGRDTWIHVPMPAVLAIYAKETQEGMTFAPADYPDRKQAAAYQDGVAGEDVQPKTDSEIERKRAKSLAAAAPSEDSAASPNAQKDAQRDGQQDEQKVDKPKKSDRKGGSHLKVIK